MLGPANLLRLIEELVFVLLGALLVVLALSGRHFPDRRAAMWLVLAGVMVLWGLRAWWRTHRYVTRWQHRLAGGSLILVGFFMLLITWVPFDWVRPLLAAAGGVLALRGLVLGAAALPRLQ